MLHQPIRRPRFERLEQQPGAVRLYDLNDYTGWFMPQGWEWVRDQEAAGAYLASPYTYARDWASCLAVKAMRNPIHGAVEAVGYIARRLGEIQRPALAEAGDYQEAAE